MRKMKGIMLGVLSVLTLGLFVATGAKVNAATYTYGTDVVSTTTRSGDTRTWDFTTNLPGSNTKPATGDNINDIIVDKGNKEVVINSTAKNALAFKSDNSNAFSYSTIADDKDTSGFLVNRTTISKTDSSLAGISGASFYVPVPEDSAGSITILWASNDSNRGLLFDKYGESYLYVKSNKTSPGESITFTSNDIQSYSSTGSYLKFISVDHSGTAKENKIGNIKVILSSGTYGAAATLHTVTYMDGTSTLKTDAEAVDGSNISYTPKKYGYDFEGWYTDASLDSQYKVNTSTYTVTGDVTLYANWTAWTDNKIGINTLDGEAIAKIATGIDSSLTADLALAPSIYTYLENGAMTTTNVTLPGASSATQAPCFNTSGALSTSQCGIKFTAPANGTFVAYVGSGGTGSSRNVVFNTGSGSINPTEGESTLEFDGTSYEPRQFTFEVEEGTTYYLGGTNGVRIYYISFEENTTPEVTVTAYQQEAVNGAYTYVRFIFVVSNDTTLATADFDSKLTLILDDGLATQQTVTRSPKAYNKITLGGSTYTNGTYEFDNSVNTNDIYVVYVVKFTTETYIGHNVKASLTVNEVPYKTSGYNFVSEE